MPPLPVPLGARAKVPGRPPVVPEAQQVLRPGPPEGPLPVLPEARPAEPVLSEASEAGPWPVPVLLAAQPLPEPPEALPLPVPPEARASPERPEAGPWPVPEARASPVLLACRGTDRPCHQRRPEAL